MMGSKRSFIEEDPQDLEDCSTFTVNGFYGNARQTLLPDKMRERVSCVAKATTQMEERPLPSRYNPGVLGPPTTWKAFRLQAEAIKYSQLQGEGLMVFSFESDILGGEGKRNYVVTHPRMMFLRLLERNPKQRCSYEVIQEHSVCKLYFDLEFSFLFNQNKDGDSMVNTFIRIVCYFLQKEFGVKCTRRNVVDLNSCSFLKFSRHLIFNIPNVAFATNIHAGNFVIMVCDKIREWHQAASVEIPGVSLESVENLFVEDSKKNKVLFCDEGVYTKNRNFRLLHSTKLGKNTPLIIALKNQYTPFPKNGISKDEQFFLDSMVTTVNDSCRVITFGDSTSKVRRPCSSRTLDSLTGNNCYSSSPYPEIDSHIQRIVQPGYVRCWFYFSQSELLVYEIAQNRFCYNIGREHKSNGVMYVVSLKTGVYYQKCHDVECRDFRSDAWRLPESALFWKKFGEDEMMEFAQSVESFSDGEDEILVTALTRAELEEMSVSDEELCELAENLEMWDNMDKLSSKSYSLPGSQRSTQSSQGSNPWDRLSQLSTPDNSYFANLSEILSGSELNQRGSANLCARNVLNNAGPARESITEIDSDEEFAREAARIETQFCLNTNHSEVEFSSCEL